MSGRPDVPTPAAIPDLPDGIRLRETLRAEEGWHFTCLAWSPDGRWLAVGERIAGGGRVRVRELATGRWLGVASESPGVGSFNVLAWAPDGRTLAAGDDNVGVHTFRLEPDFLRRSWSSDLQVRHGRSVYALAWSPGGERLAAGDDFGVRFLLADASAGGPLTALEGPAEGFPGLSWKTADRLILASFDSNVYLWSFPAGTIAARLVGHSGGVHAVAQEDSGRLLWSGGGDGTVRQWDTTSAKQLAIVEGLGDFRALSLAAGCPLLAAHNGDGRVYLLRADSLERVVDFQAAPPNPLHSLAFHPSAPLLAVLADDRRAIALLDLDVDRLLPREPRRVDLRYSNAKVVLVGDTGVGKSGLAHRLLHGEFVATESSHARRAHVLQSEDVTTPEGGAIRREIVLWDLAGQPAYRLVHQLSMDDAAVACVLFDARSETRPLEAADYWAEVLQQARTNAPLVRLLVATRIDVGGLPASADRIRGFAAEHGFAEFFQTSAKSGEGCQDLGEAVRRAIRWDDLPVVSSTEVLAAVRGFVARLTGEDQPAGATPLRTVGELYEAFAAQYPKEVALADFIACLERLEQTDVVDLLVFHATGQQAQAKDWVLLDPTRIDAYASALLVAAKDEPDGPGHLLESRVVAGQFHLVASERLADKESERLVLWYVMESLFARDLALREQIQGREYVVFPAQCTTELRFPGAGSFGVAYGFRGPVRAIYATLIAQLAHFEGFSWREFYQDAAAYKAEKGERCVVRLHDYGTGRGELEVSFDEGTPSNVRQGFLEFVARHLESKSVPQSVTRRHAFYCRKPECRNPFEDRVVKLRLDKAERDLVCPVCEERTPLVNLLAPATAASTAVARRMDADARAGRRRITAAWVIKSKEARGLYDVFLSHNAKDKPAVRAIATRLKAVGIRPWLDEWDMVPGETVVDALEKAIRGIPCAALFFGPADVGRWHVMEIRSYVDAWAREEARFIPVILPGVEGTPELPVWVRQALWVDMREWEAAGSDAFGRLVCGIVRRRPADVPLGGLTARDVFEWQGTCD